MSGPSDELIERVLAGAAALSRARTEKLLAEATREAEAEVKSLLKSAIKAALLRDAAMELDLQPARAPEKREKRVEDAQSEEPTGCYVYCVTSGDAVISADDLPGVEEAAVYAIADESLQALISAVPLSVFTPEALRERFDDSSWVEHNVRAHDQVLRAASLSGPVVPFRFCTVLRNEADAHRLMQAHRSRLRELLDLLDGKREWGVKFLASPQLESAPKPMSGREYLLRKQSSNRQATNRRIEDKAAQIHAQLEAIANDAALLPIQEGGAMVLNAAYLLDREAEKAFDAALADAGEPAAAMGLNCEVTGPWPPYSFVKLDLPLNPQKATEPSGDRPRKK